MSAAAAASVDFAARRRLRTRDRAPVERRRSAVRARIGPRSRWRRELWAPSDGAASHCGLCLGAGLGRTRCGQPPTRGRASSRTDLRRPRPRRGARWLRSAASNEQSRGACQRQVTPERSGGPRRPRDRWLVQSTARNSVRCLSCLALQQTGAAAERIRRDQARARGTSASVRAAADAADAPSRSAAGRAAHDALGRLPSHQAWVPSAAK